MSFVSVHETVGSRKAILEWDGAEKSSYTRVFQVIADATVTDLRDVRLLAGNPAPGPDTIPTMGTAYPTDATALVHGIDPQEEDGHFKFLVFVHYRQPDAAGVGGDPTDLSWTFSTDVQEVERVVDAEANNGNPVANSAGEPFYDPLTEVDYVHVINLQKWFSTWSLATQFARQGKMNDDVLTLLGFAFPAHCLRCTKWVTSGKQELNGGEYYQLAATFVYRTTTTVNSDKNGAPLVVPGWDRAVVDQGFNERKNGELVPILDKSKKAVTVPQLLDGFGSRQPDSNYVVVFLPFETVEEADMSTWNLPAAIP